MPWRPPPRGTLLVAPRITSEPNKLCKQRRIERERQKRERDSLEEKGFLELLAQKPGGQSSTQVYRELGIPYVRGSATEDVLLYSGLIRRDEGGLLRITPEGLDFLRTPRS